MINKSSITGHLSAFIAYAIFGFNIIVCKDLTSGNLIPPLGIFTLRSLIAGGLFWIVSLFLPREKVEKQDYIRIFAASMLGFYTCQVTFLVGFPHITPMDCSILTAMSPIYTMAVAAIVIKEPITLQKAGGVAISFIGIICLIVSRVAAPGGVTESTPFGIVMIILNSLSFSMYLGIFKPLIAKYSVVTFMKWIFLFSAAVSLPLSIVCGTCVPDNLRNFHYLFPHSSVSKEDQTDSCKHVQLYTAHYCDSCEYNYRNGHPHMAESAGCIYGLWGCSYSKLQQECKQITLTYIQT